MSRPANRADAWFKSRRSDQQNACVEVNRGVAEGVGVRDSKDQAGAVLSFDDAGWREFVAAAKDGKFNLPA